MHQTVLPAALGSPRFLQTGHPATTRPGRTARHWSNGCVTDPDVMKVLWLDPQTRFSPNFRGALEPVLAQIALHYSEIEAEYQKSWRVAPDRHIEWDDHGLYAEEHAQNDHLGWRLFG